jgi:MYXO-CTERM domain-containing protein
MDRLRQRGIEPKHLAMAAAAIVLGLLTIRRRRHRHAES